MNGLPYDFTNKKVSPWGGLRLIEETYRRSGLKQYLEEECQNLPAAGSNRGYISLDLADGFMVSTILGATRLAHSGTLRHDEVIRCIFGWNKGMDSQSTFSRFFRKFDQERNDKLFPVINWFWFSQLKLDKMTIDLDSNVITRHGSQDGVAHGYNPKRHRRGFHHPLIALVAEAEMVAHNLISLFRLQVLNQKHNSVLSTIRFQCIAIGSYQVKTGLKTTLRLSAKQKRRQFLEGLFSKVSNLSPPFQISNA